MLFRSNFFPSPGRISFLRVPAGPGIRDDSGVSEGDEVSIHYDPMISKLAAWGRNRGEAIDRLRRALDEYAVGGIKTSLPFFREVVRDEEFIAGRLDTGFIARFQERRSRNGTGFPPVGAHARDARATEQDMAIIAAALAYTRAQANRLPKHRSNEQSKWKLAGRAAALDRAPSRRVSERR